MKINDDESIRMSCKTRILIESYEVKTRREAKTKKNNEMIKLVYMQSNIYAD